MPGKKRSKVDPAPEAATALATKAAEGEVLLPAVPDDVVEEVYQGICKLQRGATIALAVETGKLIVDRFYGGDLTGWRTHGSEEPSLKKLAAKFKEADGDTGISAPGLFRILGIYEIQQRIDVSARKHLTATHVRAVIGLPAPDQERLLAEAEDKAMSTRKFEEKVAKIRKKASDGRGRPPLPAFVKTTNMLGKLAKNEEAFGELELLSDMEPADVQEALDNIEDIREKLAGIEAELKRSLSR